MVVAERASESFAFTDQATIRRVHAEGIVLLGGGRALLMQIAHPSVAAAVAAHSSFQRDPLGRLLRTLRPTLAIVFGSPAQVAAATASINRLHAGVVGSGYHALDPALLAWVLATLIDTTLLMHERFVGPLPPDTAAAYYAEMKQAGVLLGMPGSALPAHLVGFNDYVADMVATLAVTATARNLAAAIFRPAGPSAPLVLGLRELSGGLLPPRLRREFGFDWGGRRDAMLRVAAALSRQTWPRLPRSLRRPPALLLPRSSG